MKKQRLFISAAAILFAATLISGTLKNGGSPGGKTGSPIDVNTCTQCHGGSASSQTGWISSDIPAEGYTPGNTYTITATGTHSGAVKFGFELTAETSAGKTGTFTITNSTETKLVNSNHAVTHTVSGNTASGGTKSWSVNWTAPAAGTGTVRFYAAYNAANGNGSTSGDVIYTSNLAVNENTSSGISELKNNIILSPNPVKNILFVNSPADISEILIFDISGKQVLAEQNLNSKSVNLNVNFLQKGIYFTKIKTKDKIITKKILIQ